MVNGFLSNCYRLQFISLVFFTHMKLLTIADIIHIPWLTQSNEEWGGFLKEYIDILGNTRTTYVLIPIIIYNEEDEGNKNWYTWRLLVFDKWSWKKIYATKFYQCVSILYLLIHLINLDDIHRYIDETTGIWTWIFLSKYRFISKERVRVISEEITVSLNNLRLTHHEQD